MSRKAFESKSGTVWDCEDENGLDIIFLVLDGHVNLCVTRATPVLMSGKKMNVSKPVDLPFRNYLNLTTGECGQFSKDSLMNKKGRRI